MPRIVKKKDEIITYSVLDKESAADYLKDPDLFKDLLPQPYRRIDKILQEIFEETWNILEKAETEKQIELNKYRPEKVDNSLKIPNLENFNCFNSSADENNEFLFVGSHGSLVCIDANSETELSIIDKIDLFDDKSQQSNENTNIISIKSSKFKQSIYFVTSLSETGYIFLHLFVINKFYQIHFDSEGERKYNYKKCVLSNNCNYMALLLESKTNASDCFIEIYKCQKDLWNQFTDNIVNLIESKRAEKQEKDDNQLQNPMSAAANSTQQLPALAKPILFCKIKPPSNLLKPQISNTQNLTQILKSIDSNSDCIGIGLSNCFTKGHIDLKTNISEKFFNVQLSEDQVNQISGIGLSNNKIDAEFGFLLSNRFINLPISLEQQTEIPNNFFVCWNQSTQILFYPLGKLTKDMESKFEYSMPFSSQIKFIELSKCNSLIALGFINKNVSVFDLNAGVDRCCVNIPNGECITRLFFLPTPANNEQTGNNWLLSTNTIQFKIQAKLLCLIDNGEFYLIDCSFGNIQKPELVFKPNLASKDDKCIDFVPCKNLNNLVLVTSETKKVFVLDVSKSQLICEFANIHIGDSFQMSLGCRDQILFIKNYTNDKNKSNLKCQLLRRISKLDNYFKEGTQFVQSYLPNQSHLSDRIKNLLNIRIDEQMMRKERLGKLWNELTSHRNI